MQKHQLLAGGLHEQDAAISSTLSLTLWLVMSRGGILIFLSQSPLCDGRSGNK